MGKLLFFKKRYRSLLSFGEHWWREDCGPRIPG